MIKKEKLLVIASVIFLIGAAFLFVGSNEKYTGLAIFGNSNPTAFLDYLHNNCHMTGFSNTPTGGFTGYTCDKLCGNIKQICIRGSFEEYRFENGKRYTAQSGDLIACNYPMYNSSFGGTMTYNCMCCAH